jgi:hypothetical protein
MYIMKLLTYIMNKIKPTNLPNHLGRWRIEDCSIKTSSKIDLSNEDHCGPCGQYALEKVKSKTDLHTDINSNKSN